MSTLAAPRMGDTPPISYLNAWWGLVQAFLAALILTLFAVVPLIVIGDLAGLPLGPPGGSDNLFAGASSLLGWPFDPNLLWFRAFDLLALGSLVLWLGHRLQRRFLFLDVELRTADAMLSVGGLLLIASISRSAGFVATFVIAGLLRRVGSAPTQAGRGSRRRWGRWLAAAWAAALVGGVVTTNLVPVSAEAGSSCAGGGGTVQPPPGTTFGVEGSAVPYQFRSGGTFVACAVAEDRAWFAHVTVLGIDTSQLPANAPWDVQLTRDGFAIQGHWAPVRAFTLAPRSNQLLFALVRFTSCAGRHGRTFTLTGVPLRVRAYGRTQTDLVRFSQPVQTTCPY